jgi:hypothetical protein
MTGMGATQAATVEEIEREVLSHQAMPCSAVGIHPISGG